MAAEGYCDRMASDMGVCVERRYAIEILHAEKDGTHRQLLIISEHFCRPNSGWRI